MARKLQNTALIAINVISIFCLIAVLMGQHELGLFLNLLSKDATGIAMFFITVILFLLGILVYLYVISVVHHIIGRFIFGIKVEFEIFFQAILTLQFFLVLAAISNHLLGDWIHINYLFYFNPLIIAGFYLEYRILKGSANVIMLNPLLFTIFLFILFEASQLLTGVWGFLRI
jgi:hypothetical protein